MIQPTIRLDRIDVAPGGHWYWLESTAPIEVEDPFSGDPDVEQRIDELAAELTSLPNPHVVIQVHGYNNALGAVRKRYDESWRFVTENKLLEEGTAWVGYRWPSERLGHPLLSGLAAFNGLLWTLLFGMLIWLGAAALQRHEIPWPAIAALAATLLLLVLLRLSVYYRDQYRAINYGVLDLVEFIRKLDFYLNKRGVGVRVRLSFIGHSMGGLVVTNTVRIVSDVFDQSQFRFLKGDREAPPDNPFPSDIGSSLTLFRLVLVSPDIPAEAIMTGRANYLAPSLRRFPETTLFSNAGDVVLGQISTTANYFGFPNRRLRNGRRLGNASLAGRPWGLLQHSPEPLGFLKDVNIGGKSILELLHRLNRVIAGSRPEDHLAAYFNFIDCTAFRERNRPSLTFSKDGRVGYLQGALLLLQYLFVNPLGAKRDVHSGYFDFEHSAMLLYGCVCRGFDTMSHLMADRLAPHRFRVLPAAYKRSHRPGPPG